jgi:hypothetical protein
LKPRTRRRHLENAVERYEKLVDQKKSRYGQAEQTEGRESRSVRRELTDVAQQLFAVLLGQQTHHDQVFESLTGIGKSGESGESRKRQGKHRHDGRQSGQSHRGSDFREVVFAGAIGSKA